MADTSSESLHEAIQRALNSGDFETTCELSSNLGKIIIREAQGVSASARRDFLEQGMNRIREHLNLARVLRAHVNTRLQENTALCLYQNDSRHGNSWHFDA